MMKLEFDNYEDGFGGELKMPIVQVYLSSALKH